MSKNTASMSKNDESRWALLCDKDASADGKFFYAVVTTGIYCRPSCPSRMPKRENVKFYDTAEAAVQGGFRACKRCKPGEPSKAEFHNDIVTKACRLIETSESELNLEQLSTACGLSAYHFHRIFKRITGLTPKAYSTAHKAKKVQENLSEKNTVTDTIYNTGFNSNGRFYEKSDQMLGMQPSRYKEQGSGSKIRFAIGECKYGAILVAATDLGICAISLDDEAELLLQKLQDRFPKAQLIGADTEFEQWVAQVVGFVENPETELKLPLDIQGSAFQKRVWQALCKVPFGQTVTYTDIAKKIGKPKSVRAVANAIGANKHAIAIPCHRVIRSDGSLSGYRWGVERKRAILASESR